jgi:hypothetical protein
MIITFSFQYNFNGLFFNCTIYYSPFYIYDDDKKTPMTNFDNWIKLSFFLFYVLLSSVLVCFLNNIYYFFLICVK